jgi:ABC-type Fe3+/spermidine/putrescine transport system ATPase subunit
VAELTVHDVTKSFGGVPVLTGLDLAIKQGEFFTLLGPSGCGKTTLLRIIAGFLTADRGSIQLAGTPIDTLPAHKRDIGMVFQDYAVFPHLSVADNLAFGLRLRKLSSADIASRVEEGLRMVHLEGFGARYPAELSGGQQQRVGLARAIVIRPKLLLMDEPLSNLDAKLRLELRDDIRDLQRSFGITTVYVTHDQEEALAISDRIAVMNRGIAEQIGTPSEIYRMPTRRFAASFIGAMNLVPLVAEGGLLKFGGRHLRLARAITGAIELAIRPEHVGVAAAPDSDATDAVDLDGTVLKHTYLGAHAQCLVATLHGNIKVHISEPGVSTPGTAAAISLRLPLKHLAAFDTAGDRCEVVA